jgi:hypothetical protein
VAGLPERDRQVVEMFLLERLSDAEIGQRLGCSAAALRVVRGEPESNLAEVRCWWSQEQAAALLFLDPSSLSTNK